MKRIHVLMAGLIAAVTYVTYALAAGQFSNYPVIGGAAFCSANAQAGVPGTSTVCVPGGSGTNVPAGPTIVTGTEIVPADSGNNADPRTFVLTLGSLNAFPYQWFTVANNALVDTFIMSNNQGGLYLDSTATIASVVIQLPPNPIDGQRFWFGADRSVTAILISPATGQTLANISAVTALTASATLAQGYEWLFRLADSKWYRLR